MNAKLTFAGALLAVLALATLAVAQQAGVRSSSGQPGLECAKARSRIDRSICADAQLVALERRAAALFELAVSHARDAGELKKAQRRWLREREDCKASECIKRSYERRIRALETFTGRLPETLVRTLCTRFETPETRVETLARTAGSDDINNDGAPETATACEGGTAGVPCVSYVDADERPVTIQPHGFEWLTYSPLGRSAFRYADHTFVYYSRDTELEEPSYVSYVTPTNRELRICDFETTVGSAVVEGGAEVCAATESGEGIEPIELTSLAARDTSAFERANTFARSIAAVDIDNDGLDDDVIELSYESGDGRGCTFNYFELLTDDRRSLLMTSKSAPVRELQGISAEGYRGRDCGRIDNRLFRFDGKTYYETNVDNTAPVPHELRVLEGTAVATLCTFERHVTTRVRHVFVE